MTAARSKETEAEEHALPSAVGHTLSWLTAVGANCRVYHCSGRGVQTRAWMFEPTMATREAHGAGPRPYRERQQRLEEEENRRRKRMRIRMKRSDKRMRMRKRMQPIGPLRYPKVPKLTTAKPEFATYWYPMVGYRYLGCLPPPCVERHRSTLAPGVERHRSTQRAV